MDTDLFRERQELERVVQKLDRDLDAVVVEGYCDRQVLQKLGFNGKIFLSAERTLDDLVEDVSRGANTVGILTDFDKHGKKQAREISHALRKEIDVIESARSEFGRQLTSTGRMTVEDAKPLFHSKDQKFVDAALDEIYFRDWSLGN